VGCGGLSGGGLRTMLLGAADPRIGCTVQVGYFTTSEDMILNVSYVRTCALMAVVPRAALTPSFATHPCLTLCLLLLALV
jgi:hypothetical protein